MDVAGVACIAVRAGIEDAGDRVGEAAGEDAGGAQGLVDYFRGLNLGAGLNLLIYSTAIETAEDRLCAADSTGH